MKRFLQIFCFTIALTLLLLLILTFFLQDNNCCEYIIGEVSKINSSWTKEIISKIRILANQTDLFFQLFLCCLIGCFLFMIFKIDKVYSFCKGFLSYVWHGVASVVLNLKNKKLLIILIIPFISSVYFGLTMPVSFDEATTFLDFTNTRLLYCISSYPYPNNHVLHSIITHITKHIPFFGTLFCLRISSIIFSFLTWVIIFSFLKKFYSEKTAFFVTAIASMLFMSVYYSYMSRGYTLVVLFFMICLYSSYNIIKNEKCKNENWMIFTVSSILGFYTMPSFLYPYLTINLLIFINDYRNIKRQIIFNLFILLGVLTLYMPIIIHQGMEVLTNNPFVRPQSRLWVISELPGFSFQTIKEIFGVSPYVVLLFFLLSVIVSIKERNKESLILWSVFLLVPLILLIVHSVIPFPRTFVYYGFVFVFLIAVSFRKYIDRISLKVFLPCLIIIQIFGFVNFKLNICEYETFNIYYKEVNDKIIEADKTYYVLSQYNCDLHRFELFNKGYDINKAKYDAIYSFNYRKLSADTIKNIYDYIIIDADKDVTTFRKPLYSNEWVNVYGKE